MHVILEEHSDLGDRLNNLGSILSIQYERTGEMRGLEEAIRVAELAVKSTPEDYPDRKPGRFSETCLSTDMNTRERCETSIMPVATFSRRGDAQMVYRSLVFALLVAS